MNTILIVNMHGLADPGFHLEGAQKIMCVHARTLYNRETHGPFRRRSEGRACSRALEAAPGVGGGGGGTRPKSYRPREWPPQ